MSYRLFTTNAHVQETKFSIKGDLLGKKLYAYEDPDVGVLLTMDAELAKTFSTSFFAGEFAQYQNLRSFVLEEFSVSEVVIDETPEEPKVVRKSDKVDPKIAAGVVTKDKVV